MDSRYLFSYVQSVVWPILASAVLWNWGASKPSMLDVTLSTAILMIATVTYSHWKVTGNSALPLYSLLAGSFWIFYGLPCFLDDRSGYLLSTGGHILSDHAYSDAIRLVFVGLLAAGLGWSFRRPVATLRVLPPWIPSNRVYLRILLLIGSVVALSGSGTGGGLRQGFILITSMVPGVAFSILFRAYLQGIAQRLDQTICMVYVFSTLIQSLAGGSIGPGFILASVGLLTYLHERKRLPLLACVVMICGFFFLQVGKGKYRQEYWGEGNAQKTQGESVLVRVRFWITQSAQIWIDTLTAKSGNSVSKLLPETALSRASLLSQTANVVEMTPGIVPYQGLRLYSYLAVTWIPRVLWPDKPSMNEANQFYQRAYLHAQDRDLAVVSIAVGYMAEGFISAGLTGTLLVMFVVGLFLRVVDRKMLTGMAGPLWQAIAFFWLVRIFTVDEQFAQIFSSMAQQALVAVVLFRPMIRKISLTPEILQANGPLNTPESPSQPVLLPAGGD